MKPSRYEQETIVNYNAEEQTATVCTRDKAVMRKLDTLAAESRQQDKQQSRTKRKKEEL